MGNESNLIPVNLRTKEEQREIQRKGGRASGKKRRERKTIADALRLVLDEPITKGSRTTKLDAITVKVVKRLYDSPNVKDLKAVAEILGELKQTIQAEGLVLNIQSSEEGKDNIERLIEGE